MKRLFTMFCMVSTIGLTMLWNGCTADVDLDNIDTSVEVEANIATPIGSITATIDDFVGDGTWGIFIDTVDHEGVITFRDTFSIARDFHKLDLSKYISRARLKLNVYEPLDKAGLMNNNQITGNGVQIPLTFPLTLKLDGINKKTEAQRIDSALIKNASFTSKLTAIGNSPIQWEWIDKVTLDLGDRCYRPEGNIVTVYDKNKDTYGYTQDIPTNIDEFSINLMKNKNLDPEKEWKKYIDNVVDSCTFNVTIYLTIPTSAGAIPVPSTAAFQYDLGVQFIDYHAVWGMFEPSKDMSGQAVEAIATYWSPWNTLQDLRLPFVEPSVDMLVTTQVAGAMIMEGDYLYTENEQGKKAYATFDGNYSLYKFFNKNEYLSLNSPIGTEKTMHILFDKDPSRGHIDSLFSIRPDKIGYKFAVKFNEQETPQIRITKNTSIKIDAVCKLPMILSEGVSLGYSDKIKGIDLSMLDLDSLLKDVEMIDTLEEASAKLVIKFENSIPLQFKGVLTCLDENDNVIIDPKTKRPLLLTENDTILIAAPEFTKEGHEWNITPLESVEVINVDREDLETLRQIKTIEFHAWMDDESLAEAYKNGLNNIQLKDDNYLKVKIAVGANVEGVLNLEF